MQTAGTTETFELKFLYYTHKGQRWQAEVRIGEVNVILASAQGMNKWYVKGYHEVKVPENLSDFLSRATHDALADYQSLKEYKKAVGKYPKELIQ